MGQIEPITAIRESMKAVPAMRYALALTGLAAAVAIARTFLPDVNFTEMLPLAIGAIIAMACVLVFSAAYGLNRSQKNPIGAVFLWAVCIFIVFFMAITGIIPLRHLTACAR